MAFFALNEGRNRVFCAKFTLMQYDRRLVDQDLSVPTHIAPLVISPSDTVIKGISRAAGGHWAAERLVTRPLRTVLLTVVFTLNGAGLLCLPE
jgi:hypothetical protein